MDGQPPLPMPEVCPVTLDELLSDGLKPSTGTATCVAWHAGRAGGHHAQDLTNTLRADIHHPNICTYRGFQLPWMFRYTPPLPG
jgi:hypothetical protein